MTQDLRKYGLFIGGKETPSQNEKFYIRENPATGKPLAEIAEGGVEDIGLAVKAASQAFPKWSKTPPSERARILLKIAEKVREGGKRLAVTNTLETGKPIRESIAVGALRRYNSPPD